MINLVYKSVVELGFSVSLGSMSVFTLFSGGNEDFFIGFDKVSEVDVVVEKEVKYMFIMFLFVVCDVVWFNLEVMSEFIVVFVEKEKIYGDEL